MSRSILYVEDEEDFQMLVSRLLGKAGMDVEIAGTGEEGLAALRRQRPDLIILDVNLPDANGFDLCRRIREETAWCDLPILMLTVRRRPDEWLQGFASGADDYVSKPLNPPELIDRVECGLKAKTHRVIPGSRPEFLLIQSALAGNKAAFAVLIAQYKTQLIHGLSGETGSLNEAEDVVASAFLQAFERLAQFRGQSSFFTWIYSIALHELSHRRRISSHVSLDSLMGSEKFIPPSELMSEDNLSPENSRGNQAFLAEKAFSALPIQYRRILELNILQQMQYDKIAEVLQIPIGTVMSRLHTARRLLKKSWSDIMNPSDTNLE